jgi:GNAT superfamily N-acetyltransferase
VDERRETSPWVTGMIVRSDSRGHGIGRALMRHLEHWAIFMTGAGQQMTVLSKQLP